MKKLRVLMGVGLIWLSLVTGASAQANYATSNLRTATWNIDNSATLDSRGAPTLATGNGIVFNRVTGSARLGIGMSVIPSESFHIRGVTKLFAPVFSTYVKPTSGTIDWRLGNTQEITLRNTNFAVSFTNPPAINYSLNATNSVVVTTLVLLVRVQANAGGSITGWSAATASNNIVFRNGPGSTPIFASSTSEVVYPIFFYYTKTLNNGSWYYGDY